MKIKRMLFVSIYASLITSNIYSDSFKYNTYNNHGVIGLINMPTARMYSEGSHGFTFYYGSPDQKMNISSSPFNFS